MSPSCFWGSTCSTHLFNTFAAKANSVVEALKPKMRAGELTGSTNQQAVQDAEFVVIAVPYEGQAQIVQGLKGQVAGKIIIDTVVPLNKVRPFVPPAGSALQEAQQILGDEAPVPWNGSLQG